ncbi:acetolactate synthase small subunit [Corynebacterium uberis]|uniref:acetolactate synthase small subunit n=1 Tax=Corynebacterium TaxID=1716 RepID=UPI001D0ADC3D|nr:MULTISPECIES: acetolactate synthase small subunit [Corynebacterium]MCZ9309109.1 acetolactate synthase small subunit [Corynebacterium sp. c6VSa_13]UDL74425.1 acetolactate synthase small subunit [Corynebacterium uberis]UDL76740.1 acetolactate synthase small subunit [Corynebacterium uberis]UDL78953.1 acetolactate synthase small subunit [Corynebacterium uberis]UDL81231.1 acetolactate synthase small subunit [Corynebacterium uberis]
MDSQAINRNILSVLVQDVEGIITRVSGMFTRRAFNLVSLVSARTETEGINRITIVVDATEISIEQITKQLNKIVPVLKVVRLEEESTVARSLMLVKVNVTNANRPQVVDAATIFRARVVDVAPDSVVIEATGSPGKLQALLDVLDPFGIREMLQSGQIALNRGPKTMAPSKG